MEQPYSTHLDGSEDIHHLLRTLTTELAELECKTKTHLINIGSGAQKQFDFSLFNNLKKSINVLKLELDILEKNIRSTFGLHWQKMNDQIIVLKSTTKTYRDERTKLKTRCQNQEEIIQKLEKRIGVSQLALNDQNLLATKLGSLLSEYLWKLSQNEKIVKTLVTNGKLTATLLVIVNDYLKFFSSAYKEELSAKNSEMQCLNSLIGSVLNIAALYEGRKFIIATSQGQEMIRSIVQYLKKFPNSRVQRCMLMAIFNVSINENGTKIVIGESCLFDAIKKNLMEASESVKYVSLKLVHVLASNTNHWKPMKNLMDQIPLSMLSEIEEEECSDEERKLICDIRQRYLEISVKK